MTAKVEVNCADCGYPRSKHSYNGACYGTCGKFRTPCAPPAPVGDIQSAGDDAGPEGFAPCPTCKQYSHSIGNDAVTAAYNHFHTMIAHPVRGHPMGDAFDAGTQDAAKVLCATLAKQAARIAELEEVVRFYVDPCDVRPEHLALVDKCAAHRLAERERLATVTPEVIEAGAHVLSEWLNDNAPIGESVYRKPAEAAYLAMLKGSTDAE